ncbi:MAG: hypothetical protein JSS76_08385 [Bacteroidetes bacterium]|nr:hypothetical protein [Bacteroidota bacterium]
MALIKSEDELSKFTNALTNGVNIDDFAPSLETIEDSVITDIIGAAQLSALRAAYEAATSGDDLAAPFKALWSMVCKVALPLAIIDYISNTMALTGTAGTTEEGGANSARLWVTNQKKETLRKNAERATENLYAFLEANKGDYGPWVASSQYTEFKGLLMQTTKQFDEVVKIGESRQLFMRLKPTIAEVEELLIIPRIGQEFYDYLISQLKGTPSAEVLKAVTALRKAIGRMTMGRCSLPLQLDGYGVAYLSTDQQYTGGATSANSGRNVVNETTMDMYRLNQKRTGDQFLDIAVGYLNATASDTVFQVYFTSDRYTAPGDSGLSSVNDGLSNILVL